jgi:ribonucleotide monophosphatase NagD (HAD superfamily)
MVKVLVDPGRNHVLLVGDRFETRLDWAAAINLGSLLVQQGHLAEPPTAPGKTFATKEGR